MNRIFCLETEWEQTVHDLKSKSAVLPLLDFLRNTIKIDSINALINNINNSLLLYVLISTLSSALFTCPISAYLIKTTN